MPKLFIAVDLPPSAAEALARIQPPPMVGVRLVERAQMHLTLHYLGEADRDRTAVALAGLAFPPFALTLEGVGQFPTKGGAVTLWAGVRQSEELLGLHAAVAAVLAGERFRPEARRYTPHVTLARCEPPFPTELVTTFLTRNASFSMTGVHVTGFGLYSSVWAGDAPVYRCERAFRLVPRKAGAEVSPTPE